MSRTLGVLSVAALLAMAAPVLAHDAEPGGATPAGVRGEMLMWISDAESKLNELAEAMPEGKYAWSPDKGVRSPGDVFMHVAAANYGVPSFWGVAPPAGFDFMSYEKSLTKKADIQKALKESFVHVKTAFGAAADADLKKPVDLFGMKTTVRGAYMLLLAHAHEHLGQSIAYARMNKIAPPWTARQEAEAARMRDKMKEKGGK